jgi:hypothetical protein
MVTSSEEVGTVEPPQVVVLLQFPDTEAVLAAAKALDSGIKKRITVATTSCKVLVFMAAGFYL